jgi:hypothetical protein
MVLWKDDPAKLDPPKAETTKAGVAGRPVFARGGSTPKLGDIAATARQGGPATKTADGPLQAQEPTLRYVDRPECTETFADSLTRVYFDGQMLRIELCTSRLDELKPNTPVTVQRNPVKRLVLTPSAAVDLINRLEQVANALTRAGVLKSSDLPKA